VEGYGGGPMPHKRQGGLRRKEDTNWVVQKPVMLTQDCKKYKYYLHKSVFHCVCFVELETIQTQNRPNNIPVNRKLYHKVTKLKSKFSLILG